MTTGNLGARAARKLNDIISDYLAQGYSIVHSKKSADVPYEISSLEPDFILKSDAGTIVVQVKSSRDSSARDFRFEQLAKAVQRQPGWSLDLVWVGSAQLPNPSRELIRGVVERARLVSQVDEMAALLLGWSALESALDLLLVRALSGGAYELPNANTPKAKVTLAESLGLISERWSDSLSAASDVRNYAAHGVRAYDPLDVSEALSSVLDAVTLFVREGYASAYQMIDWFNANYEEPAASVPYDGREGGYQYFAGGPYDASEVLQENFPESDSRDVEEAVNLLERESNVWVRRADYSGKADEEDRLE